MKKWLEDHWLVLVAIVALVGALMNFPFVYYQVLNWIVTGAALMTAYKAYQRKNIFMQWLFVAIAVLFNPVAPLHLSQDVWRVADVIVAVIFVASLIYLHPHPHRKVS